MDIEKRQPLLSIRTGGLSGPCVKPVALRMVWDVAHAVNIPVVGLGSFPFDCPTYLVQSDSRTSFMRHSEFDIPW